MLSKDYSFASSRLQYRAIQRHDAEVIVMWRSQPENYRYFFDARPLNLEDHLAWFDRYLLDETRFDFLIESLDGTPIGTCALSSICETSCEISYMIGSVEERGKGYGLEAVRALTNVAFKELGVEFVEARILPENEASQHVATNAGYGECERVFRKRKDCGLMESEGAAASSRRSD